MRTSIPLVSKVGTVAGREAPVGEYILAGGSPGARGQAERWGLLTRLMSCAWAGDPALDEGRGPKVAVLLYCTGDTRSTRECIDGLEAAGVIVLLMRWDDHKQSWVRLVRRGDPDKRIEPAGTMRGFWPIT